MKSKKSIFSKDGFPIIIGGPCSVESKTQIDSVGKFLNTLGLTYIRGGTFKPRTDHKSFQGLGDKGVNYIYSSAQKNDLKAVTEILTVDQLRNNYDKIDVIQIGSRNMMSYGLLKEVAKLTKKDHKPVILKRGLCATISEFLKAADYLSQFGNPNIILCLRGIRTFEQIDSKFRHNR